jgi:hypothetical protein
MLPGPGGDRMANAILTAIADVATAAKRRVEGNRRVVRGTLEQNGAKYVTGGYVITPQLLGFDKYIDWIDLNPDPEYKAQPVLKRVSDTEWQLLFFSAIGTQLANESETMKEKKVLFQAWGN